MRSHNNMGIQLFIANGYKIVSQSKGGSFTSNHKVGTKCRAWALLNNTFTNPRFPLF